MSIVFLNQEFMPINEAKISPLDRGFLFGDGVYEYIPTYNGKTIGLFHHLKRLNDGLKELQIKLKWSNEQWIEVINQLIQKNNAGNLAVYIQISRGADGDRKHQYPSNISPTIFAMTQSLPELLPTDRKTTKQYSIVSMQDKRWKNCHIKSTSLLGNVFHFQQAFAEKFDESLLYNKNNELTECAACNIFIVKNNIVSTPILDNQILPGVTRRMVIDILKQSSEFKCQERVINLSEAQQADEIWITSSSKQIAPVTLLDNKKVGNGQVGAVWEQCSKLYDNVKFD